MRNSHVAKKIWQTLLITLSLAACFHLIIATITAIIQQNLDYLNPLDFLGLSAIFPQYRTSAVAAAGGWAILVAVFLVIFYISLHYHLYLSIIRESKVGKKITEVSHKLQFSTYLEKIQPLADKPATSNTGKLNTYTKSKTSPNNAPRK